MRSRLARPFIRTSRSLVPTGLTRRQHPNPPGGCNSDLAQYSNTPSRHHSITPSLRAAGFEDEDDDEDSLPDEACGL